MYKKKPASLKLLSFAEAPSRFRKLGKCLLIYVCEDTESAPYAQRWTEILELLHGLRIAAHTYAKDRA